MYRYECFERENERRETRGGESVGMNEFGSRAIGMGRVQIETFGTKALEVESM